MITSFPELFLSRLASSILAGTTGLTPQSLRLKMWQIFWFLPISRTFNMWKGTNIHSGLTPLSPAPLERSNAFGSSLHAGILHFYVSRSSQPQAAQAAVSPEHRRSSFTGRLQLQPSAPILWSTYLLHQCYSRFTFLLRLTSSFYLSCGFYFSFVLFRRYYFPWFSLQLALGMSAA